MAGSREATPAPAADARGAASAAWFRLARFRLGVLPSIMGNPVIRPIGFVRIPALRSPRPILADRKPKLYRIGGLFTILKTILLTGSGPRTMIVGRQRNGKHSRHASWRRGRSIQCRG